ncbi:MAG: hypothetical protein SH819_02620 [Cytophagales bacterium]|nr:hypothetical protein [Cytophagales bacterium]
MNNDSFEKFVNSNRDAFDDKVPSTGVWSRIEKALFGRTPVSLWNSLPVWRLAAVLLLGLSIVQFFGGRAPAIELDASNQQEFVAVESYYSAQILEKVSMLRNDESFVDDPLAQDFEKLDAMYAVLAEELRQRPSEKVKDAMVLNMLVRIDLLNRQLQKLEDSRRQKEVAKSV